MSTLPEIDSEKVISKLSAKLAETQMHNTKLEVLAEALRDQRDAAYQTINSLQGLVDSLQEKDQD